MIWLTSILGRRETWLWLAFAFLIIYASIKEAQAHRWQLKYTEIATALEVKTKELDSYKARRPEVVERVTVKYSKVPVSTSSCEETLASARGLLKEFIK